MNNLRQRIFVQQGLGTIYHKVTTKSGRETLLDRAHNTTFLAKQIKTQINNRQHKIDLKVK